MHGVVKSLLVTGETTDGRLDVEVSSTEANLSEGRWRVCISSIVLTFKEPPHAPSLKAIVLTVSISTNHSEVKVYHPFHKHLVAATVPAKIILCVLNEAEIAQLNDGNNPVKLDFKGHWNEMQFPSNNFYILFQTGNGTAINFSVHALILIERLT